MLSEFSLDFDINFIVILIYIKRNKMVKVHFFTLLRLYIKKQFVQLEWQQGDNVLSVLRKAEKKTKKEFLFKLLDEENQLKTGTIILLNGKNIFHLEKLRTSIKDNDELALFPPGGGG